jgi:hypothetical protein
VDNKKEWNLDLSHHSLYGAICQVKTGALTKLRKIWTEQHHAGKSSANVVQLTIPLFHAEYLWLDLNALLNSTMPTELGKLVRL